AGWAAASAASKAQPADAVRSAVESERAAVGLNGQVQPYEERAERVGCNLLLGSSFDFIHTHFIATIGK
ncbi:MAG: hypothetical protein D6706_19950, partial [Chloroflexi bacterium]